MLITQLKVAINETSAFARLSVISVIDSVRVGMQSAIDLFIGTAFGSQRPQLIPVPAYRNRENVCAHGISAANGSAHVAAVRMYADPVANEWRVLDFGKTDTGKTGHSQPSRFAP